MSKPVKQKTINECMRQFNSKMKLRILFFSNVQLTKDQISSQSNDRQLLMSYSNQSVSLISFLGLLLHKQILPKLSFLVNFPKKKTITLYVTENTLKSFQVESSSDVNGLISKHIQGKQTPQYCLYQGAHYMIEMKTTIHNLPTRKL